MTVLQASSVNATGCACGWQQLRSRSGRAPRSGLLSSSRAWFAARQARNGFVISLWGALNWETMSPWLAAVGPHAHSGDLLGDF